MKAMKVYAVKEIFYSLQGEGQRAGTPNVFIRFAGCNMQCNERENGFDCDTDFSGGHALEGREIAHIARALTPHCVNIIFTGGEPSIQIDLSLREALDQEGFDYYAIESNGTRPLPYWIDYAVVSPKTEESDLRVEWPVVNELRYVMREGRPLPSPSLRACHYFLSPAWSVARNCVDEGALHWCIELVKQNPRWRLSCQSHKWWGVE